MLSAHHQRRRLRPQLTHSNQVRSSCLVQDLLQLQEVVLAHSNTVTFDLTHRKLQTHRLHMGHCTRPPGQQRIIRNYRNNIQSDILSRHIRNLLMYKMQHKSMPSWKKQRDMPHSRHDDPQHHYRVSLGITQAVGCFHTDGTQHRPMAKAGRSHERHLAPSGHT
jgi:hypothetical protein